MTGRDRWVSIGVIFVVVLGAAWMLVVKPEREQATKLSGEVASAQSALASAEGQAKDAVAAEGQYTAAYTSIVNLGKAVPPSQEVPSLLYQLSQVTNQKSVQFSSIALGSSGSANSTTATPSASAGTSAAFTPLSFTFDFEGGFFNLEHLFRQLSDFTTLTSSGEVQVRGRLLTIQSIKLAPASGGGVSGSGASNPSNLSGSITATAYVLPASQGLTGGATPTSPAGATGASPAASSSTPSSAPAAPAAIVRADP